MFSIIDRMQSAMRRSAAYRRQLAELESMSEAEIRDLGLARADFPRIAYDSVYGA